MNAVIYARYSSDSQREESIEGQLRECKAYCEKHDITIVGTYIDRALSAKTDDRPDFRKMIKDSEKKQFELVVVWKLDRFPRNRADSAKYKTILGINGVKVVSATENISSGAEGILLESVLEGLQNTIPPISLKRLKEGKRRMRLNANSTEAQFLSAIWFPIISIW